MSTISIQGRQSPFRRPTGNRRRKGWVKPSGPDGDRTLAGYLRDMRATPLLEREREAEHAAELQTSRENFAGLVLELPERYRTQVLNGDLEGPELGKQWRLRDLEECHDRMIAQLAVVDDHRVSRILRRAGQLKQRIDEARDALVLANLRFVAHLARQMSADSTTYLELIQEGNLGLMEAVERYEYERGNRFSTYAYWWIRRALHLAIAGKSRMIYIPAHVRERVGAMRRAGTELADKLGRPATIDELADRLGLPTEKVRRLQSLAREPQPLDTIAGTEDAQSPIRYLADEGGEDPLQSTLDREMRRKVLASLRVLSPQQRKIIRLRFGIGCKKRLTLKEVGHELNLSRERVRQVEHTALKALRESPEARALGFKPVE